MVEPFTGTLCMPNLYNVVRKKKKKQTGAQMPATRITEQEIDGLDRLT
jgi:hypothetical protein